MSDSKFSEVSYKLEALMSAVELGELALPDLQRPFVWSNAKVRDLFDSMYRGYPVGFLLFWQNALAANTKAIGVDPKQKTAKLLIVDGQQRLTSLYAVLRGVEVVREDFTKERIEIAFNPLTEEFQVGDAATRKDKTVIPDISVLWKDESSVFDLLPQYLDAVSKVRQLDDAERQKVKKAIQRLYGLKSYSLTALELSSSVEDDEVAEVFVRVNSQGKSLVQSDFILTLMSVYWESGRKQLEQFCRACMVGGQKSPHNHYIKPTPDQLLRAGVGLGFQRARLKHVYSLLRGKDLETGAVTDERRTQQFEVFKQAQAATLDLVNWHGYFNAVREAGYRGEGMISSQVALLYGYVLYLIGKGRFGVVEAELRRVIAQWFFMISLKGRYSSSPESKMESDLAALRDAKDAAGFVKVLQEICDAELTGDYWTITLPGQLANSAARSPALFAYHAALVLNEARVLYSQQSVADLLDPAVNGARSAAEKHHLFPKAHLASLGIASTRETNQIANYALVEWGDNVKISNEPPSKYVPYLSKGFAKDQLVAMSRWHALPDGWETMPYAKFLERRRELMAKVIREGYQRLVGTHAAGTPRHLDIQRLVKAGEGKSTEFKSTLRTNLHTGKQDPKMEHAVLRTVAGFLNSPDGGVLVVGVDDDGTPVGLEEDGFGSEDKLHLHFDNIFKDRIGPQFTLYVHPHFSDYEGKRVLLVSVKPAGSPAFLKDGGGERFYVRAGASTSELMGSDMQEFIKQRFK